MRPRVVWRKNLSGEYEVIGDSVTYLGKQPLVFDVGAIISERVWQSLLHQRYDYGDVRGGQDVSKAERSIGPGRLALERFGKGADLA